MATQVVDNVRESGGDYPDFASWIAAEVDGVDLVALDRQPQGKADQAWVSAESGALDLTPATTSSTCYPEMLCTGAARMSAEGWLTTAWRLDGTLLYALTMSCQHARVEGLQIRTDSGSSQARGIRVQNADAVDKEYYIDSCRVEGGAATGRYGIDISATNSTGGFARITNNIIRNWNYSTSGWGIRLGVLDGQVYNNTVHTVSQYGIACPSVFSGASSACKNNCVAASASKDFYYLVRFADSDYNNSSDDSADDDGSANSKITQTVGWVDAANGNFRLTDGDTSAKGEGVDLSGIFTNDCEDNVRTLWSMGAFDNPADSVKLIDDLELMLECEDAADATLRDSSGNGRHVTLATHGSVTGEVNDGISFRSSTSQYAEMPLVDSAFADYGSSEFAFGFWFRAPAGFSGVEYMFGRWSTGVDRGWHVRYDRSQNLVLLHWTTGGGSTTEQYIGVEVADDNDWHYIVVQRSGDTLSIQEGTTGSKAQTTLAAGTAIFSSTAPLAFGCKYSGAVADSFADIDLDEVAFWSRTLSDTDIEKLEAGTEYGTAWGASTEVVYGSRQVLLNVEEHVTGTQQVLLDVRERVGPGTRVILLDVDGKTVGTRQVLVDVRERKEFSRIIFLNVEYFTPPTIAGWSQLITPSNRLDLVSQDYILAFGDTLPVFQFALFDANGPVDLEGAVLYLYFRHVSDIAVQRRTATVVTAEWGRGSYAWEVGDLTKPGQYLVVVQAVFLDGTTATFPNYKEFTFHVRRGLV